MWLGRPLKVLLLGVVAFASIGCKGPPRVPGHNTPAFGPGGITRRQESQPKATLPLSSKECSGRVDRFVG